MWPVHRRRTSRIVVALAIVLCGALFFLMSSARARSDRRQRTLETEHFAFHYNAQLESVVDRCAERAERAYLELGRVLGHVPQVKIHVVIIDSTDRANGSATVGPTPRVVLHTVAPGELGALGSYDDWIEILLTHELVHVLHLDTIHGIPRLVNAALGFGVLGRVMVPQGDLPRWTIEGLATMLESDQGGRGRHRSAIFDMYLRTAVLERKLQTRGQVSSTAAIFPFGNSAYLYGLHMMHWIGVHYGRDKLAELSHVRGGRLIYSRESRAVRDVLGVDFDQLWREFLSDISRRFEAQERQIRARGIRQGRRLTFTNSGSKRARWSPDDRSLYFYDENRNGQGGIRKVPAQGVRAREGVGRGAQRKSSDGQSILELGGSAHFAFVGPNEDDIVLHQIMRHDMRYRWGDLYRWRGGGADAMEQITFAMRANYPDVSPDGRTVVFSRTDVAQSRLAFLELDSLRVRELAPMERISQVTMPRWSPDGSKVAYSGWREGGFRDIYVYDRASGVQERITSSRSIETAPAWSPDGRFLLFISDRTGVFNIYAFERETKSLYQVSNVLGGAFHPILDHTGTKLVYSGFTSQGYDLWKMDFDPDRFLPAMTGETAFPVAGAVEHEERSRDFPAPSAASTAYRAHRTFFPRSLLPSVLEVESTPGRTALGVSVEFSDIMEFHHLRAHYGYLPDFKESVGGVEYSFRRLVPNFRVDFVRDLQTIDGFGRYVYEPKAGTGFSGARYRLDSYLRRSTAVSASVSIPALRVQSHRVDVDGGYYFHHFENLNAGDSPIDPNAPGGARPVPETDGRVRLGVRYSNLRGSTFSYGSERGRSLSASVSVQDEVFLSESKRISADVSYRERLAMPWRGHQVLAYKLSAGTSSSSVYRIGGYPDQQDVLMAIFYRTPFGSSRVIRGYANGAFSGRHYLLMNVDYPIPVRWFDRGAGSYRLFLRRLTFVPFSDWGLAWSNPIDSSSLKGSSGASLVFDFKTGYDRDPAEDRLGLQFQFAHGWDPKQGLNYFRIALAGRM